MKKYIFLLLVIISLGACSKEGNSDAMGSDSVGGSLATFALVGDYLYVVDSGNLNVFSVREAQNPTKVNSVYIGFNIETLFHLKDFLFIGSQNGMYIYSIEKPESPERISSYTHFTACDPVVSNMRHAFVTLHSTSFCGNNLNVLQVYDIADLKNPVKIHERTLTQPRGLVLIENNHLVVCDDDLKIFSIEDPANPTFVKGVNKTFKDVIYYKNRLFAFGEREVVQYTWKSLDFSDITEVSSVKY